MADGRVLKFFGLGLVSVITVTVFDVLQYCHAQDSLPVVHTCSNYTNFVHFYDIEFPPGLMHNNVRTKFLLQRQDLHPGCAMANRLSVMSTVAPVVVPVSTSSPKPDTPFKFDTSGALKYGLNTFQPGDYCIQRYDGESVSVRICNPCSLQTQNSINSEHVHGSKSKLCIPKCCEGFSQVYDTVKGCVQPDKIDSLLPASGVALHDASVMKCFEHRQSDAAEAIEVCVKENVPKTTGKQVYFYTGEHHTCERPTILSSLEERFALLENGSVALHLDEQDKAIVLSTDFCFDHEFYDGKLITMILACLPKDVLGTDDKEETHHAFFPEKVAAQVEKEKVVTDSKVRKCQGAVVPDEISVPSSMMYHGNHTWFRVNKTADLSCRIETYTIEFEDNLIVHAFGVNNTYFTPDGVLLVHFHYFQPHEYCIERYSEQLQFMTVKVCNETCAGDDDASTTVCIPKCCAWGNYIQMVAEEEFDCVPAKHPDDIWAPSFYGGENATSPLKHRQIHFKTGLSCSEHQHFSSTGIPPFEILENGSVLIIDDEAGHIAVTENFCLDGEYINGVLQAQVLGSCPVEETCTAECYEREVAVSKLYAACMLASAFFLLLTIIVYSLIWEKHNIHGWTVYALSISMFFMLVFLATGHIMRLHLTEQDLRGKPSCVGVGLLTHFFFLSTFCWMTILNFDLWWTFRNLTPAANKSKGWTRYGCYALFCIGIPFLIVLIAIGLDSGYSPYSSGLILPQYGTRCFLTHKAQGPYLYYLIAFLLLVNISMFGNTIFIMYNYQKNTKAVRRGKAGTQSQAQLFAKLFFVMGVSWIFEFISWRFKGEDDERNTSSVWIVFDLINLAQGFAIFFIFVCKQQVLLNLWHKYPKLRPFLNPLRKLPCCKITSMDIDSREISGTKVTSTHNSSSLRHYSTSPSVVPDTNTSTL